MLSTAVIFLLMLSSCLSHSTSPDAPNQVSRRDKIKADLKKSSDWFKKHAHRIIDLLATIVQPVPVVGPGIAAGLRAITQLIPKMPDILTGLPLELKALHFKLDSLQSEMRWDAWAAAAYQAPVANIEKAWRKYTQLQRLPSDREKQALQKELYSQYTESTLALHRFLTAKPDTMTNNLGQLLTDRLKCHEKPIAANFNYLNNLICQGHTLDKNYYTFTGQVARVGTADELASQSASALTQWRQKCVSDSAAYIERDVFERIDDTKSHQEISDGIRDFLVTTYDRYDWMVVSFWTKFSSNRPRGLKGHVVSKLTKVKRGSVTVAVAKQVKGGHAKAVEVRQAVEGCLRGFCPDVVKKLDACQLFGKSLLESLTAVHAYSRHRQSSHSGPVNNPHFFEGRCGVLRYEVMIKSDEEMTGVKPCANVNCGQNGRCVPVPNTSVGLCQCDLPFYGEQCELSCNLPVGRRDIARGGNRAGRRTSTHIFTVQDTRRHSLGPGTVNGFHTVNNLRQGFRRPRRRSQMIVRDEQGGHALKFT